MKTVTVPDVIRNNKDDLNRRTFLKQSLVGGAGIFLLSSPLQAFVKASNGNTSRNILLRSGWQVENIGDIAHTPSMLSLIEKNIPGATVTFWPWYDYMPDAEREMILNHFPKLTIVQGKIDVAGKANTPELEEAIITADFFCITPPPPLLPGLMQ